MLIALRPLEPRDADTSIAWRCDPGVWTHTLAAGRDAPTIDDERRWIERVMADPTSLRRAILVDGDYVGNTYLTGIGEGAAEFHIFIGDRNWWGRRLASQVTRRMLDLAWGELGLDRIDLIVHPDNVAAVRMYRQLGFVEHGMDGRFMKMALTRPSEPKSEPE